jgi:hypothetical protein
MVLDIGSRLGAALYGVRVLSFDEGKNYSMYILFGFSMKKLINVFIHYQEKLAVYDESYKGALFYLVCNCT